MMVIGLRVMLRWYFSSCVMSRRPDVTNSLPRSGVSGKRRFASSERSDLHILMVCVISLWGMTRNRWSVSAITF